MRYWFSRLVLTQPPGIPAMILRSLAMGGDVEGAAQLSVHGQGGAIRVVALPFIQQAPHTSQCKANGATVDVH